MHYFWTLNDSKLFICEILGIAAIVLSTSSIIGIDWLILTWNFNKLEVVEDFSGFECRIDLHCCHTSKYLTYLKWDVVKLHGITVAHCCQAVALHCLQLLNLCYISTKSVVLQANLPHPPAAGYHLHTWLSPHICIAYYRRAICE